jgi:pyridoxal phosphate enzyme (YggS family)
MTSESSASERRDELGRGLDAVRSRIASACAAAGRATDDVTLIVVTKTYPASDVRALHGLGVRDVGENREQEAAPKHAECAGVELRWHLIGRLQTNKCRSVARWADVVHSLDRMRVVEALNRAAVDQGRSIDALIQVSLDGDPARGGALLSDVPALADAVAASAGLNLRGLMAVAPLDLDPAEAFDGLAQASGRLRTQHPGATWISAGMSQDLEAAIAAGATHVRVGSAVLGARPTLR